MQELSLPFPPPSSASSGSGSRSDPVSGEPVSGGKHKRPPSGPFLFGADAPDVVEPPFSAVAPLPPPSHGTTGTSAPGGAAGKAGRAGALPWAPPEYVAPIESAWYQLHGGGQGFSADDMECLQEWYRAGIPSELVVQVIREQVPPRSRTGVHVFRRSRIYRLRYFHAEVMRRWKPPVTGADSAPPVSGRGPTGAATRSSSRAGSRSGSRRAPSDAFVGSPVPVPASPSLSSEEAGLLRQELCGLLDTLATSLETAPRLWAARNVSLPQTSRVCLAAAESIRDRIHLIETTQRVCILDLENTLMALDESIWSTLRNELPSSVVSDVMASLARVDMASRHSSSRVSANLIQLEREQRLRRWALECHHLPLELTVAGWWESVVVPAGGGASF